MEKIPSSSLLCLSLYPCEQDDPQQSLSKLSKKPPFSPPPPITPQDTSQFSPSPAKKRQTPISEKVFTLNAFPTSNEIKSFERLIKKQEVSQKQTKRKSLTRTTMNQSFTHNVSSKSPKKILNFSAYSPCKPSQFCVESKKTRVFTPVLTEKKRKMLQIQNFCKKISLFETGLNKIFVSADTCSSFKDQSTRIEDSTTIGEITPIKEDYALRGQGNDFSFNSPVNVIKVFSSPEEGVFTPEAKRMLTPEMVQRIENEFLAPRKVSVEFFSPESNDFVISSSSDVISEVSACEDVTQGFGDISLVTRNRGKGIDKEVQTDVDLKKILDLLENEDVIDGLKLIGKFKSILRIINSS